MAGRGGGGLGQNKNERKATPDNVSIHLKHTENSTQFTSGSLTRDLFRVRKERGLIADIDFTDQSRRMFRLG